MVVICLFFDCFEAVYLFVLLFVCVVGLVWFSCCFMLFMIVCLIVSGVGSYGLIVFVIVLIVSILLLLVFSLDV